MGISGGGMVFKEVVGVVGGPPPQFMLLAALKSPESV